MTESLTSGSLYSVKAADANKQLENKGEKNYDLSEPTQKEIKEKGSQQP